MWHHFFGGFLQDVQVLGSGNRRLLLWPLPQSLPTSLSLFHLSATLSSFKVNLYLWVLSVALALLQMKREGSLLALGGPWVTPGWLVTISGSPGPGFLSGHSHPGCTMHHCSLYSEKLPQDVRPAQVAQILGSSKDVFLQRKLSPESSGVSGWAPIQGPSDLLGRLLVSETQTLGAAQYPESSNETPVAQILSPDSVSSAPFQVLSYPL